MCEHTRNQEKEKKSMYVFFFCLVKLLALVDVLPFSLLSVIPLEGSDYTNNLFLFITPSLIQDFILD
jgi:hypothetical protein